MTLARRGFLQGAGSLALASVAGIARAERYPSRPVHILVGFPPAGGGDIAARLIGQWLSERLGQPFIVENRPGGATNLATEAVVRAPPDGHTLLMAFTSNAINATLYDRLSFNFIEDVAPVAAIMRTPEIMQVHPSFPAATVPEFISFAKAHPGTINMASGGRGALGHVTGELFKAMAGVNLVHVPYRGDAAAVADLLGGRVQVHFGGLASAVGFIRSGKLRLLAVTTATRCDAFPDVRTVAEFLPGYESSAWFGIGAPRHTPTEIVEILNREINGALADPKIKSALGELGASTLPGSPADFGKLIRDDTEKWRNVIRSAKLTAE